MKCHTSYRNKKHKNDTSILCMILKEGLKVKFYRIKKFVGHDFLQVALTSQTSRTNNKRVLGPFDGITAYMEHFFRDIKETYISV